MIASSSRSSRQEAAIALMSAPCCALHSTLHAAQHSASIVVALWCSARASCYRALDYSAATTNSRAASSLAAHLCI